MGVEINKFSDIIGVVPTANIPEGRMVLLTSHSFSYDFGSRTDLPGVKLPADSSEAARAKYVLLFAVDNRSVPIYQPTPSYKFALRQGFDRAENSPFSATVYLTHPGNMTTGQTIPSGVPSLAFGGGVFTIPSGYYVYSANLETPGATLEVLNQNDDPGQAGLLAYNAAGTIAVVERYNSATGELTFRTLMP